MKKDFSIKRENALDAKVCAKSAIKPPVFNAKKDSLSSKIDASLYVQLLFALNALIKEDAKSVWQVTHYRIKVNAYS